MRTRVDHRCSSADRKYGFSMLTAQYQHNIIFSLFASQKKMATDESIIEVIRALPFADGTVLTAVLIASISTDLGPLVRSLHGGDSSDAALLANTLAQFAALEPNEATPTTPPQPSTPPRGELGATQLLKVQSLMTALLQRYRLLQGDFDNLTRQSADKDKKIAALERRVLSLQSAQKISRRQGGRRGGNVRDSRTPSPPAARTTTTTPTQRSSSSSSHREASPSARRDPSVQSEATTTTPSVVGTPQSNTAATPNESERRKRRGDTAARQHALLRSYTLMHNEAPEVYTTPDQWVFNGSGVSTPQRSPISVREGSVGGGGGGGGSGDSVRRRMGYQHVLYPQKRAVQSPGLRSHASLTPPKGGNNVGAVG